MVDAVAARTRALLGGLVVAVVVSGPAAPAMAAVEDCGGGEIELLQDDQDPTTVVGARVSGIGAACDGQPVGVQFLGNEAGAPALPAEELARAYSDEDACTGTEQPGGVLQDGTVDVLLCEGSGTADHVDGRELTRMRLLTTAGVVIDDPDQSADPDPVDDPPPAAPGEPDPAPDPPAEDDLPVTGADVLRAVLLGGTLVLAGGGLVRLGRAARGPAG